jgi:hypothetical protein
MNSAKRSIVLILVLTVSIACAAQVEADDRSYSALRPGELFKKGSLYTESIDMMFDVRQGGELSLGTTNGSVRINTWSKDKIRLVITKTTSAGSPYNARTILEDFLVQARHQGSDLRLKGVAYSETCKKAVGVKFEVWVPENYNVAIDTGDGNVDIGKLQGSFTAKTANGKISFECDPDGMDIEVQDNTGVKDHQEPGDADEEGAAAGGGSGSELDGDKETGKTGGGM